MLSTGKHARLITVIALALSALSLLLRTLSVLFFFDSNIGYYSVGAVLPIILSIFLALFIVALAICAIFLVDRNGMIASPSRLPCYTASLVALALIFHIIDLAVDSAANGFGNMYDLLTLIAAIASAAFFLIVSFSKDHGNTTAILGTGFILWLALVWMSSYSDFTVPMNSPHKIFFHLGCIGASLLTVGELRTVYGISKPRFYCFSLWCSLLLLASSAIPSVLGAFLGIYTDTVAHENYVLIALFVYACVRAVELIARKDKNNTDTAHIPQQPDPSK